MTILLALASAVVYGIADYCGGRSSRTSPSVVVAFVGQVVSLVLIGLALGVAGTELADGRSLAWGVGSGVSGAIGLSAFYFALASGSMSVVAPLTAVVGAVLPVGVGLATGERPAAIAYVGIGLAIAAVALVSGAVGAHERATSRLVLASAVLAGLGFGGLFVGLDRTADDSGAWPLLAARLGSIPLLAGLVVIHRARRRPIAGSPAVTSAEAASPNGSGTNAPPETSAPAATNAPAGPVASPWGWRSLRFAYVAGVLDMGANVLYLEATRGGLLSLVAVVSSLYPASTVTLAFVLDRERIGRGQVAGIGLAAVALVFVTLGRG